MLKGFVITPVQLGRIAMGEMIEHKGKRLPKASDHFKVTSLVQENDEWRESPVAGKLKPQDGKKLRSIPVRVMFDNPENNFRAEFTAFDRNTGRPLCAGNGEKARRRGDDGVVEVECPGPDLCKFGAEARCKLYARLFVSIDVDGSFEKNPLAGFVLRTTSFNTVRSMTATLHQWAALTGGMAGFPANLIMRAKSTTGSMGRPIFYAELEPRESLVASVAVCAEYRNAEKASGINRAALEAAVAAGYEASSFLEDQEEGIEIVEEFYADPQAGELLSGLAAGAKLPVSEGETQSPATAAEVPANEGSGAVESTTFGNKAMADKTIASLKKITDRVRLQKAIDTVEQFFQGDLAKQVKKAAEDRLAELVPVQEEAAA